MKKLNVNQMESLEGGIVDPGPGGFEACRGGAFANFLMSGGDPTTVSIFDFECIF